MNASISLGRRQSTLWTVLALALLLTIIVMAPQTAAADEPEPEPTPEPLPLDKYPPMPIPEWQEPLRESTRPNRLVSDNPEIDVKLNLADIAEPSAYPESGYVDGMPLTVDEIDAEFLPVTENGEQGLSVDEARAFTALSKVTSPSRHPWRVNVKLFMTFQDRSGKTNTYSCSGVLIDSRHVLTAGHCLFSHNNGEGWARRIITVPAYDDGDEPYGRAVTVAGNGDIMSWANWTTNADWKWDIGFIKLDRPVGLLTGWHGYGYNDRNSFFSDNSFYNPGYPGESPYNGQYMYSWHGRYDRVTTHIVYHNREAYKGQSGSGSYHINSNGHRHVYAIQSHRNGKESGLTRINSQKFNSISSRIRAGRPRNVDLIVLDTNASPGTVTAGNKMNTLNFLLHNASSARWNGKINFDIYLSTNSTITTGDTKIGSGSLTRTLNSLATVRVNAPLPRIPIETSGRTYYVGVILRNSDHDRTNNQTNGWDAARISVKTFVPPKPSQVQATDGQFNDRITLTWGKVSGATQYEVYRAFSATGPKQLLGRPTSNRYTDRDIEQNRRYYYFVRAKAANGQLSSYSTFNKGWADFYKVHLPAILGATNK